MKDTIVLAYSGGLDTSVALRWLADEYDADVIALLVDVGQGIDVEAVTARALAAGASDVVVIDARDEFAAEYVLPVLQAGALYEGRYPLVSALSRPLIAQAPGGGCPRPRRRRRSPTAARARATTRCGSRRRWPRSRPTWRCWRRCATGA